MDNPVIKTTPELNKEVVNLLRIGGEFNELYAAQRIEELEKQVAELEFQQKTIVVRSIITLYDEGLLDFCSVHEMVEHFTDKIEYPIKEKWQFELCSVTIDYMDAYHKNLEPNEQEFINRIREVIGMVMPT